MVDREQMVQREKRRSPLSDREIEEADDRSSTTAKVVHEAIRLEGTEELGRPTSSLVWSGFAAGLTMGCSMLGRVCFRRTFRTRRGGSWWRASATASVSCS